MKQTTKIMMALSLILSMSAFAALDLYEGFDYPADALLLGQDGGMGFSDAWYSQWDNNGNCPTPTITDGLTYTDGPLELDVSGNSFFYTKKSDTANAMMNLNRKYTKSLDDYTGDAWFSYLVKYDGLPSNGSRMCFYRDAAGNSLFKIGKDDGASQFFTFDASLTSTEITTGQTLLMVTKFAADGNAYLWVNPDLGSTEPATLDADATSSTFTDQYKTFALFLAPTSDDFDVYYDEMRLGDTWADVAPIAVPEPSLALLSLLGLAFFARKK